MSPDWHHLTEKLMQRHCVRVGQWCQPEITNGEQFPTCLIRHLLCSRFCACQQDPCQPECMSCKCDRHVAVVNRQRRSGGGSGGQRRRRRLYTVCILEEEQLQEAAAAADRPGTRPKVTVQYTVAAQAR